jgi:glycosyltransferase involved in cell wall biosynthesis
MNDAGDGGSAGSGSLSGATLPARGLRVVMVAPTPFFSDRGCHVRILEEARGLARAGAEVAVCTYFLGDTPEGLDVRRAAPLPGYRKRSAGPAWGKIVLDGFLWRRVRNVVAERRPQVIHAHLHEGIGVARFAGGGAVRILDVQGGLTDETLDHRFLPDWSPIRRTLEAVERRLDGSADFVVTSHPEAARVLTGRFGVPDERVRVVGDAGVPGPPDPSRAARYRERFGIAEDERIVLYAGLLGRHQGTQHLLDAAEAMAGGRARILVLGYPEERWRAEAERRGLGGRMIFAGRFPYADFAGLLTLGTVALSPKTSATEGNQKLYAYLGAGLPVVAFDTPVNREILGEAGVLVPLGESGAMAEAARALLADPERRRALSEAARARARALGTWDDVVARILDAYRAAGAVW